MEQLATVVATFFESCVSREILGGDRPGSWLEVFAQVVSAWAAGVGVALEGDRGGGRGGGSGEAPSCGLLGWSAWTRGGRCGTLRNLPGSSPLAQASRSPSHSRASVSPKCGDKRT